MILISGYGYFTLLNSYIVRVLRLVDWSRIQVIPAHLNYYLIQVGTQHYDDVTESHIKMEFTYPVYNGIVCIVCDIEPGEGDELNHVDSVSDYCYWQLLNMCFN